MSIDLSKTYKTRDGRTVMDLRTRDHDTFPIAGAVDDVQHIWTDAGTWTLSGIPHKYDLVEVTEHKETPDMIDLSKTYRTRDVRTVTDLRMRDDPNYPVTGEVHGVTLTWTATGSAYADGRKDARDLVEVKGEPLYTNSMQYVVDSHAPTAPITGGSSDYYKIQITNPTSGGAPYTAECNDIIRALNMNYAMGNAFKAVWRLAAGLQGHGKPGVPASYDAKKVAFFGNDLTQQFPE